MAMDQASAKKIVTSANVRAAKSMAQALADQLDGLAAQVWAFGLAEGPRRALAIVAQMGAELAVGAAKLYEAKRWYAGAALVRQLIEVEYLLFLFALDATEPQRWLNASDAEARKIFSPASMQKRSAGRFRVEEYQVHCKIGGHPRTSGHVLLREHLIPIATSPLELFDPAVQWVDLAQHIERLATHYVAAVTLHSPTNIYPDRFTELAELIADWRRADPDTATI
jgi:hypothetical protein